MRKYVLLWLAFLINCSLYSENNLLASTHIKPNHVYFGPEIFILDLDTHVRNIKVSGVNVFEGLRFRYEYVKPSAWYGGFDLFSAISNQGFHAKQHHFHFHKNSSITGFSNFELRLGYTVLVEKNKILTPFLGIGGYYCANYGHHFHFRELMLYYAVGMRNSFEINRGFAFGLNWKIFHAFDNEQTFKYKSKHNITKKDHNNIWGGEFGIPFVWHVGSAKKWDIQLEPYFLKLDFSEVQNIYGIRLLFGYLF